VELVRIHKPSESEGPRDQLMIAVLAYVIGLVRVHPSVHGTAQLQCTW
jgi:hypothetical protein